MIGVIPGGDQRPGQEDLSVPGARCAARLPGPARVLSVFGVDHLSEAANLLDNLAAESA